MNIFIKTPKKELCRIIILLKEKIFHLQGFRLEDFLFSMDFDTARCFIQRRLSLLSLAYYGCRSESEAFAVLWTARSQQYTKARF